MDDNNDISASATGRFEKPADNFLHEIIGDVIEIGTGIIIVSGKRPLSRTLIVDAIADDLKDRLSPDTVKLVVFEGYTAPEQPDRLSFKGYEGDIDFRFGTEVQPTKAWSDWQRWMEANHYLLQLAQSQALIFQEVPESFMVNAVLAANDGIVVINVDAGSDQEAIGIVTENMIVYGYKGNELMAALLRVVVQTDIASS